VSVGVITETGVTMNVLEYAVEYVGAVVFSASTRYEYVVPLHTAVSWYVTVPVPVLDGLDRIVQEAPIQRDIIKSVSLVVLSFQERPTSVELAGVAVSPLGGITENVDVPVVLLTRLSTWPPHKGAALYACVQ
jgi:hypothetical protein